VLIVIFIFNVFNDIEEPFIQQGVSGIDLNTLKMFLILYADDIVLVADNAEDLQNNLMCCMSIVKSGN